MPYSNLQTRTKTFSQTPELRLFRSQKSGLTNVLTRTNTGFNASKNITVLNSFIAAPKPAPQAAFSTRFVQKPTGLGIKTKKLNIFSPVDHLHKFLNMPVQGFASGKKIVSESGNQYEVVENDPSAVSTASDLQKLYEQEDRGIGATESVGDVSRNMIEVCSEELEGLKQSSEFEEPRWEEAQKWLEATDYVFVQPEENFACLTLKEDGELPAVRISWNPTYTAASTGEDDDLPGMGEEEGEDEELEEEEEGENEIEGDDSDVYDQPFEIQLRNPNNVAGGQIIIQAIIGPDDKFYIQKFWNGAGPNLSLNTWLSGEESEKLNYAQIEEYSTDFRHTLYDYLDVVGISDNVSRFIAAHTRVNKNVKQREMMLRFIQFMDFKKEGAQEK